MCVCIYRQIRDALYDDEVRGHICTAAKSAKRQFGRGTTASSSTAADASKGDAGSADHAEPEGGAQTQTAPQGEPLSAANAAEVKSIMAEFEALIESVREDAAGIAQDSSEGDEGSDGEGKGQGTQGSSSEEVMAAAPATVKKTAATANKKGMLQMHTCKILYHTHIILVILCAVLYIGKATPATPATTFKKQVTSKPKPKKVIKKALSSNSDNDDDDDEEEEEEEEDHYLTAKRGDVKGGARGGKGVVKGMGKATVEKHSDDCLQDTDSSDGEGDEEEEVEINDENTTNKPATVKKRGVLKGGGKTSKTTTAVAPSTSTTTSKSVGFRSRGGAARA